MDLSYDVVVVGGGHAGVEAALVSARMGARTLLMTMNIFTIGQMSCNPAIGGLAKGQLVRELDALGGEMGMAIDDTGIQFKMLNTSKGPAVWSPRAQADRVEYATRIRQACEQQENLELRQDMGVRVEVAGESVIGVYGQFGTFYRARAIIVTAGTFLNGVIHIGLKQITSGRAGEFAAQGLTESLLALGFEAGRLKTGTPPRIDGKSVDWSKTIVQPGDSIPRPFSFRHEALSVEQVPCYLTHTNRATHEILRNGLAYSPLYTGRIKSIGPRYCPSIEDKIVRFADKETHQIFLEPEGRKTTEIYVNGFATSLPEEVQIQALRTVAGLENVVMTRPGYAVEYDFFPPTQLRATLETRRIKGLFFAGQINGTTGYEEAAVQGLMAGINAVLSIRNAEPFVLSRGEAYIGVLIDDLVTKGTIEPYRMFTSRAEHRLLLRQDNADLRLMHYGHSLGTITPEVFKKLLNKQKTIARVRSAFSEANISPDEINPLLSQRKANTLQQKETLAKLLKRTEIRIADLLPFFPGDGAFHEADLSEEVKEQVEIEIKYEGFIDREKEFVQKQKKLENRQLPETIRFEVIDSLSSEAKEKLSRIRPRTLAQASRISGVSPADITAIMVYLAKTRGNVSRETIDANA